MSINTDNISSYTRLRLDSMNFKDIEIDIVENHSLLDRYTLSLTRKYKTRDFNQEVVDELLSQFEESILNSRIFLNEIQKYKDKIEVLTEERDSLKEEIADFKSRALEKCLSSSQ